MPALKTIISFLVIPLAVIYILLFTEFDPENPLIKRTFAVALLMAAWWITEAVPLAVTSLLPVATPPNAIIFGTGRISVAQMAGKGLVLNLAGAVLIALVIYFWGRFALNISI